MGEDKKIKNSIKIFSIIFAIILIIGLLSSAFILLKPFNTKRITANYFTVGGITKDGDYLETDDTIYTKDLIGCEGLKITPTLTNDSEYELFFYDYQERFLYSTGKLTTAYKVPDNIKLVDYCRIVIYPDMKDLKPVEFKITNLTLKKYVNNFNITVDKLQGINKYENIFELDKNMYGKRYSLGYLTDAPIDNEEVNSTIIYKFEEGKNYYLFSPVSLDSYRCYYATHDMKVYSCTHLSDKAYSKIGDQFYIYHFRYKEGSNYYNYFALSLLKDYDYILICE